MRAALSIAVLFVALATGQTALGSQEQVAELIRRAEAAERELEYDLASDLWGEVLEHPDIDEAQRLRANFQAGCMARIRGQDVEARLHFVYVLKQQPDYPLPPGTSPKISRFFDLVRQEVASRGALDSSSGPASMAAPSDGHAPWLLIGGGSLAGLGALTLVGGGLVGWSSQQAHDAALASGDQVARNGLYDQRDQQALVANALFGVGGLLVLGGAAAAALELLVGE